MVYTIGCGFSLQAHSLTRLADTLWLVLGGATVVGVAVYASLHLRRVRGQKVVKWLTVTTAIAAVGTAYGFWQAAVDPVRLDSWAGRPVTVEASVLTAKTVTGGRMYELLLSQITSGDRTLRCQVKVDWALWKPSGAVAKLAVGESVHAFGVLVFPPVRTSKGVPLRADLAQAGIYYEFEGRLTMVQPQRNSLASEVRTRLAKSVARLPYGTADEQTLLSSVVFGGENVSTSEKQVFLKAGLLHILAASGANLMLVEQALVRVLRPLWSKLRLPTVAWSVLLIAFNWGFALLCGMGASMTRAALLASYRQVGHMLSRRVRTLDGLAAAAIVQSVVTPSQVGSASFLLSFVATGALAMVLERTSQRRQPFVSGTVRRMVRALLSHVWSTFVTCVAIELALFPLTLTLFGQLTPYAVVTNVLAEPLLALLLPVAALYIAFAALAGALPLVLVGAAPLATVTYGALSAVMWLANTVAKWPAALVVTPKLPNATVMTAGAYALVIASITLASRWRRIQRRMFAIRHKAPSSVPKPPGEL